MNRELERRRLIGFRPAETTLADERDILDIVSKSYLNQMPGGVFSNPEQIDGLINHLRTLPQTMRVQERILDLENQKLKITASLSDLDNDKNAFDIDLRETKGDIVKDKLNNPLSIIGSYAALYGYSYSRFSEKVLGNAYRRWGSSGNIPAEVVNYREQLRRQAEMYSNLFNSYVHFDGPVDPDAFLAVIDVNPTTKKIRGVDIIPSHELNNETHMRTDISLHINRGELSFKKLPIALRTFDVGYDDKGDRIRKAMIGDFEFLGGGDTKEMKIQRSDRIGIRERVGRMIRPQWLGWEESVWGIPQGRVIENIKREGLRLDQFEFNNIEVPENAVLRMGNRLFFSGEGGNVSEMSGVNEAEKLKNLNSYLQQIGEDPRKANVPFFVNPNFLISPDGSSRVKNVIDENYLLVGQEQKEARQKAITSGMRTSPDFLRGQQNITERAEITPFFAQRGMTRRGEDTDWQYRPGASRYRPRRETVVRLNEPQGFEEQREAVGDAPLIPRIIEKGRTFFRDILGIGQ